MTFDLGRAAAAARRAFTIIEMLMVLFIIAILMSITIGVVFGVRERARAAQARVELAAIASALEQFKTQYGDFPQTGAFGEAGPTTPEEGGSAIGIGNAESKLVNALMGVWGPRMTPVVSRTFLDAAALTFEIVDGDREPILPGDTRTEVPNALLDPWNRRYQYFYRAAAGPGSWTHNSYVLFCAGRDGIVDVAIATDGTPTLAASADDLMVGR